MFFFSSCSCYYYEIQGIVHDSKYKLHHSKTHVISIVHATFSIPKPLFGEDIIPEQFSCSIFFPPSKAAVNIILLGLKQLYNINL